MFGFFIIKAPNLLASYETKIFGQVKFVLDCFFVFSQSPIKNIQLQFIFQFLISSCFFALSFFYFEMFFLLNTVVLKSLEQIQTSTAGRSAARFLDVLSIFSKCCNFISLLCMRFLPGLT